MIPSRLLTSIAITCVVYLIIAQLLCMDLVICDLARYTRNQDAAPLRIDHQRTIFGSEHITLSWKGGSNSHNDTYQINSTLDLCNNTLVGTWTVQETTFAIPVVRDGNYTPLYLQLASVNSEDGTLCVLQPSIAIRREAITVTKLVSFKGFCVDVMSHAGVNVVLPSAHGDSDCICPILFSNRDDSFATLHRCACASDTIFQDSFVAYQSNLPFVYNQVCFHNLTSEMNSTVIHFFELNFTCSRYFIIYRSYFQSLKISIVLPEPPYVYIDVSETAVNVNFSSTGLDVDFYRILIADVTNQIAHHITTMTDRNRVSISNSQLFEHPTCGPFLLRIQAHNNYGFTETNSTITDPQLQDVHTEADNNTQRDLCQCIKQTVTADVGLLSDSESGSISLQVNCSHTYQQNVILNLTVMHKSSNIANFTYYCGLDVLNQIESNDLECDIAYNILVFWIPNSDLDVDSCELQNAMVSCAGNTLSSTIIILIVYNIALIFFIIIFVVVVINFLQVKRHNYTKNN